MTHLPTRRIMKFIAFSVAVSVALAASLRDWWPLLFGAVLIIIIALVQWLQRDAKRLSGE